MKPVAIFRFSPEEGPGYFAEFLDAKAIPWELIKVDLGDSVPLAADDYAGICLMGGPMSVNDRLPWLPKVVSIVRDAFVKDVPMIGHCLGGQLISKGLGGLVRANSVKEIGWSRLFPACMPEAKKWLGSLAEEPFIVFQWHGETFDIPMHANLIATNKFCRNQMVALGPHFAMQCHIEMTPEMIASWCAQWEAEQTRVSETVQASIEILSEVHMYLPKLRQLADSIYSTWIKGLMQKTS